MKSSIPTSVTSISIFPENHTLLENTYGLPPPRNSKKAEYVLKGFPKGVVPYSYIVTTEGPNDYDVVSHTHPEKLADLHIGKIAKYVADSNVSITLKNGTSLYGKLLCPNDTYDNIRIQVKSSSSLSEGMSTTIVQVMQSHISRISVEQEKPHQEDMTIVLKPTSFTRDSTEDKLMTKMQLNSFNAFFQSICTMGTEIKSIRYSLTSIKPFMDISSTTANVVFENRVSYTNHTGIVLKNSTLNFKFRRINWSYSPSGDYGHREKTVQYESAPRALMAREEKTRLSGPISSLANIMATSSIEINHVDIMEGENTHEGYSVECLLSLANVFTLGSSGTKSAEVKAIIHHTKGSKGVILPNTRFVVIKSEAIVGEGITKDLVIPREHDDDEEEENIFSPGTYTTVYIGDSPTIIGTLSYETHNKNNPEGRGGTTYITTEATITNIDSVSVNNIILLKYMRENEKITFSSLSEDSYTPNGHFVRTTDIAGNTPHPFNKNSSRMWYERGGRMSIFTIIQLDKNESFRLELNSEIKY